MKPSIPKKKKAVVGVCAGYKLRWLLSVIVVRCPECGAKLEDA